MGAGPGGCLASVGVVAWRGARQLGRRGGPGRRELRPRWCVLLRSSDRHPQPQCGPSTTDPMRIFMARIRRHRRDTVQSPLETYLREINEMALLTADEEKMLAYRIAQGDNQARDRMVRANLRLVVN